MSLKRIMALFIKELQDMKRNWNILFIFAVGPLMAIIYRNLLDMPSAPTAVLGILMGSTMVGIYVPAMMLAEEKEKNTLRVLMVSPATPADILTSKGLVSLIGVLLTSAITLVLSQASLGSPLLFLVTLMVGTAFLAIIGFIIGLLSPNQMATGYIGLPLYLLFLLIPMLGQVQPAMQQIAKLIPTYYIGEGVFQALNGATLIEGWLQPAMLAGFLAVALVVFLYFYRRKELVS